MKNAFWGYWLILFGVFIVVIMLLVQNLTNSSTQDYYLIKELTEAAMVDAVDYTYYRNFGEIRINKEKFYESFARRFSETASLSTTYTVSFYGVYEAPPKASVEIKSKSASFNVVGDSTSFDMVERINAIIEGNPVNGRDSSSGSSGGTGSGQNNNKVTGTGNDSTTSLPLTPLTSKNTNFTKNVIGGINTIQSYRPTKIVDELAPATQSDTILTVSYTDKPATYTYTILLKDYIGENTSKVMLLSKDYFGSMDDYRQYLSDRERKATLANGSGKYNSKVSDAVELNNASLRKEHYTFDVSEPYLDNGNYKIDVTVNVTSVDNVNSFHDNDLNSDIYFVPIKLVIQTVAGVADPNDDISVKKERAGSEKVLGLSGKDGDYIQPLEPLQGAAQTSTQTPSSSGATEDPWAPWVFPIGSTEPTDAANLIYLGPPPGGYRISSPVTMNRCISGKSCADHIAIDIAGPAGANVISASSGRVTYIYNGCASDNNHCSKNNSGTAACQCGGERGNQVYVLNDNGVLAIYQHLQYNSIYVWVGKQVKRGELLARLGSSGYSTGSHLHFEVHENPVNPDQRHDIGGTKVNPESYVNINNPRP